MRQRSPQELEGLKRQQETVDLKREELRRGLPHLYGWDWYDWAWAFYTSTNRMNLLCAANQISKSSTQIRKCIEWAGNPSLWPKLWKSAPRLFWYLYPDKKTATQEFETKWIDFLPAFAHKDHKTYGYRVVWGEKRQIDAIVFNSGVTVQFKTYAQDVQNLQSGTVHAIFCDEELPEDLYSELNARLFATDGYFHMVFTATLNQDFWKMAIEGEGESERFPDAHKQQVSMYDCQTYKSGQPGAYDEAKIKRVIASCKSETEVQRRVNGRFITEIGRKYAQFDASRHYKKPFDIPRDWKRWAGVDLGGGGDAHPPAICFIAVQPDYRMGIVYDGWRGDDGTDYTNGDVLNKFIEMRGRDLFVAQKFDQNSKDFATLATRASEPFTPSEKSHLIGEGTINTLFKNDMLYLFRTPELEKLGGELTSLLRTTPKRKAKDDFCDAMRYPVVDIPWDWSSLKGEETEAQAKQSAERPYTDEERVKMEIAERRGELIDEGAARDPGWEELEAEMREWNEIAGGA